MYSRATMFRWISGLFPVRAKPDTRRRRLMSTPFSAWVDVLENRELLSATIPFTINAPTSLASQDIYVAMYGSVASPVTNAKTVTVQYNIEWDASGTAQQVPTNGVVEVEKLTFTPNAQQPGTSTATVYIPDIPNGNTELGISSNTYQLNGARLVFGIGHAPYLSTNAGGVAAPAPSSVNDPNTAQSYDFVEFTLDQAGMHINTSTVDQFGYPITVAATPVTTIALASNGASLPEGTINVVSTAGFASQGAFQVMVGGTVQTITYTGLTATSFTGSTGGTGTLATGQQVWSVSTYITPSGVGVQLNRQDVFSGLNSYPTYLSTVGASSPFLSSLLAGNTTTAPQLYQPALGIDPLSVHSGTSVTVEVFNVSPNDPLLAVNFGGVAGTITEKTYDSASKLTKIKVTPPTTLTNTTVDVTVTSTGGTSPTYPSTDYFTFGTGGTPTVTGLSTSIAPIAGGNTVIINGSNFTDPSLATSTSEVLFGTTKAAFTVLSTTQILAIVPPHVGAGAVNVTVTINGQTATTTPALTYHADLPVITRLSSNNAAPGQTITIGGYNFAAGQTTVKFGSLNGTNVHVVNDTTLTVTVPQGGTGTVDITVTTTKGTSPVTPDDRFTFPAIPAYSDTSSLRLVNPSDILAIESNPPNALYAKCQPGGQLADGVTYYYVITPTSNTGEGLASDSVSAMSNGIPGFKSIALTWQPFFNATGYNVYRSTSSTGPFKLLAHVNGGNSTAFLDDGSATPTAKEPPTNIHSYDPLASYFDLAIYKFFNHYAPKSAGGDGATFTLNYGGVTFTGTTKVDSDGRTYLAISGSDSSSCKIYRPFFNTNTGNANYPPPPPGLATPHETPGQMVFSGDGVFALDTGGHATDVENVIVAALNRGIANNPNYTPDQWGSSPSAYYNNTATANFYAGYMHQSYVSLSDARPSSLGGPQPLAYGFAFDDQAGDGGNGYGSYFTTPAIQPTAGQPVPNGSFAITVTFGSWAPASSVQVVSPPQFSITERPLGFSLQLVDQNGGAVLQGGKEITLQVTGPWRQTNTYTLVTAPNGTVNGISTKTGKPVEIARPGNYTLTFSMDGIVLQTETLKVSPRAVAAKRAVMHATAMLNQRQSFRPSAAFHQHLTWPGNSYRVGRGRR